MCIAKCPVLPPCKLRLAGFFSAAQLTQPLLTNVCISAAPGAHIFQVQKIVRSRTTTRI